MHKLSHVEAQRVVGVLHDSLEKLSCLSTLPSRPRSSLFRDLENVKSFKVLSALESQFQLEEALVVERDNNSNTDYLEKKLRANTRSLCRLLREDIQALNVLFQLDQEEEDSASITEDEYEYDDDEEEEEGKHYDDNGEGDSLLTKSKQRRGRLRIVDVHEAVDGLREVVYQALTTTVEDVNSQKVMVQNISTREKEAEEDRRTLEHELAIARRNRQRVITDLDSKVIKVRAELREVKQAADAEENALNADIKRMTEQINKDHQQAMERLLEEEEKLSEQLEKDRAEMEHAELQQQKKKHKYEMEVSELVEKYDHDMLSKKREIDRLRKRYELEKARLTELEEYFVKVDEENARIAKEEEEWAEFLKEDSKEDRALEDGATAFQKMYRGYLARINFEAIKKKAKKGKKSKK